MTRSTRFLVFFMLMSLMLSITVVARPVHSQGATLTAVTNSEANFRTGPDLTYSILRTLPIGTSITLDGRNANTAWLRGVVDGQQGWIFYSLLDVEGDLLILPVIAVAPAPEAPPVEVPEGGLAGTTTNAVNFRAGPGTNHSIIRLLSTGTSVAVVGRNSNNTWFQVIVGDQEGWLYFSLVNITGDTSALPVTAQVPTSGAGSGGGAAPPTGGGVALPGVITNITPRAREIFLAGQAMGNRADVFSKIGDSISYSPYFLYPIGNGGLQLHGYTALQPVVNYFSQTGARTHFSFANASVATGGGWTSANLLNPGNAMPGVCGPGETPLACEYRVVRPALALIMIGTNDAAYFGTAVYQTNLQTIVQISIDMGVIPVLSTLPDNLANPTAGARVLAYNGIIRSTAYAYGVPLWDYWAVMQDLPNKGLSGDGIHPSVNTGTLEAGIFSAAELRYGYNMRNLTALMVLDAIWRQVLY